MSSKVDLAGSVKNANITGEIGIGYAVGGGSSAEVDKTLTISGAAADAKVTGERLDSKADKADIPDVSGLASKSELESFEFSLLEQYTSLRRQVVENKRKASAAQETADEALAKVNAVLRDYELIESITVEEDVFSVIRTTEPNGDALSLSHLYLKFTSPAYTENRVVYFAIGNTDATDIWTEDRLMYGADAGIINKNGYTTEVFCEKERGIFRNWMLLPANKVNQVNARCNHSIRTGSIKAIRIFAFSNTTDLIPAGTKIDIYGVRA